MSKLCPGKEKEKSLYMHRLITAVSSDRDFTIFIINVLQLT